MCDTVIGSVGRNCDRNRATVQDEPLATASPVTPVDDVGTPGTGMIVVTDNPVIQLAYQMST